VSVLDVVRRVPGVRGGNCFLVLVEPLTLVDSGFSGSEAAVLRALTDLGRDPTDLKQILLTHRHPDHASGAAALRKATGARVFSHRGDVTETPAGWATKGRRGASIAVDALVEDGEAIPGGFVALHTPGHTAGSVCYHLPGLSALFLGDMVINNVDRLSRPVSMSNEDNRQYEESLRRLATIEAEAGFFGHGPDLTSGLYEALGVLCLRPRRPFWSTVIRRAFDLLRFLRHHFWRH
jgi:glyoxylase-like metal-dependent hydrolase (beta-lactamase superfamily II)